MNGTVGSAIEHLIVRDLPYPIGAYSHGVVANGFLFTCGVGPVNPITGTIISRGIVAQTRQVFKNLEAILLEKSVDFSRVIKITSILQNLNDDFKDYDSVCREFFTVPYPARTTTGGNLANFLVEIDFVVAL